MEDAELPPELTLHLSKFAAWDDATRKKSEIRGKVKEALHHYSDMGALVGIVENSELWLTSIFHMNDPSELVHGLELAIDRLDEYLREEQRNALHTATIIRDIFCDRMRDILTDDIDTAFGFYVASFSKTRDDLGQWRSYADDGRGVAIEVSASWFSPTNPSSNAQVQELYSVSAVEYNEDKARKRQNDAIDRAVKIVEDAASRHLLDDRSIRDKFLRELRIKLAVPLLWNSVTTKHPAYAHEKETRLILLNSVGALSKVVKTRTRGPQIVSYVPIRFPVREPGILRHVMIGPAAIGEPEIGVENLLRANDIDPKGRVSQSNIPYRPR